LGRAECSKNIGDGQINVAPSKIKEKCGCTHDVINMNHTMFHYHNLSGNDSSNLV